MKVRLLALFSITAALTVPAQAGPAAVPATLAFSGPEFRGLAAESYRQQSLKGEFGDWLAQAYLKAGVPLAKGKTLAGALAQRKAQLAAARTPAEQDALARETATWAWTFIKKAVPNFSLERGFEFASIPRYGERQCLLQSTIIAGLLQETGLNAGLVMVWKSMNGQESNLGHVTSVLRLPSGAGDVQVDASEPQPFATHQGVLAAAGGNLLFLRPVFSSGNVIASYISVKGGNALPANGMNFLSLDYLRSQYDYYRAERTIGGVLGTGTGRATPEGLRRSEELLLKALKTEPNNALAAGVLGTVYRKQGRTSEAKTQYRRAAALYQVQGHLPAGMQANLTWANGSGL